MKQTILNAIQAIIATKIADKREPTFALDIEILKEVNCSKLEFRKAINELIREGRLKWGVTINNNWFEV